MNAKQELVVRLADIICVKATVVCQLAGELEKYDSTAVKRIFAEANEHRSRHLIERELSSAQTTDELPIGVKP